MTEKKRAAQQGRGRAVRSEIRRAEIVQAAMAVIAERGYRATSFSAVAERVGITQQGVLHHFPTKEELLIAVLEARDKWDTAAVSASGEDGWPLDFWASVVEYNTMRPGVVQTFSALLGESVTGDHPAREFFVGRYEVVRESAAATLRREFGDRLPGGLTPEQAAPLLIAVLDGIQFQWLLDPQAMDMPGAFRDFVSLFQQVD